MKTISVEELEKKFDENEDISKYMDFSKISKFSNFSKSDEVEVNIKFPKNIIKLIDKKTNEIGIDRESLIKMIVAERLKVLDSVQI